MNKSQFQDIIPPEKRSIRNIPLPIEKKPVHEQNHHKEHSEETGSHPIKLKISKQKENGFNDAEEEMLSLAYDDNNANKISGFSKLVLWLITGGAVLVLFFATTWFFTSANIYLTLKREAVTMPESMTFVLNPSSTDELGYSSITLSDKAESLVDATGQKDVSVKAIGTIIVYNNYDANSQKLIAGTRFETPKGLIFKLDKAITVPGKKTVAGKIVPGSIEATVTAEKPGTDYNIGLSDFSITGFKGDPQYDFFYGRSKSPMTGGEVGSIAVVDDQTLQSAINTLKNKLETSLKEKARKELPEAQSTINGMEYISYDIPNPKLENNKAKIEVKGTIKMYTFETSTLGRILLATKNVSTNDKELFALNGDNVIATVKSEQDGELTVSFIGTSAVAYTIDANKLKSEIAGKTKADALKVMGMYSAKISSISLVLKPFWRFSLPKDVSKIHIEEN